MVTRSPQQNTLASTENHPGHGANPWSTYWASGALHSCAGSYDHNYGEALGQLWVRFFQSLPKDAQILDLACGNGPLAALMLDSTPDSGQHCTCIDQADLHPSWIAELSEPQRARIQFRPKMAMEQLSAADGPFDAVISQYGIEYGNWTLITERLPSLLKPKGRIQFVCHAAASAIVSAGEAEREHLDWALKPLGLVETAKAMLPLMALASTEAGRTTLTTSSSAHEIRSRYDQLLSEANNRVLRLPVGDVLGEIDQHCTNAFKTALNEGLSGAQHQLEALHNQLIASRVRLTQLSAAALSEERIKEISAAFHARGILLSYQPVWEQDRLLGWQITN